MDRTDERTGLVDNLDRLLAERGWSYYRAMVRFDWQMNWDAKRDPMPPAIESLHEGQLRQLCALLEENVSRVR